MRRNAATAMGLMLGLLLVVGCGSSAGPFAVEPPITTTTTATGQLFTEVDERDVVGTGGDAGETPAAPVTTVFPADGGVWSELVRLRFDDGPPFSSSGSVDVEIAISGAPGLIGIIDGPPGQGDAVRFPAVDEGGADTSTAISVQPVDSGALDIDRDDFRLGADVLLDVRSVNSSGDTGNNIVQRGLFSDASQIKLQVDDGTVSCRVSGSAGEVFVRDSVPLRRGVWYRVECSRVGDRVVLTVIPPVGDDVQPRQVERLGTTGTLAWNGSPMSVGGKIDAQGIPVANNFDQFNGAIDNVVLAVGAEPSMVQGTTFGP